MLVKNIMSKEIHYIKVPGNRDNALTVMREKGYSGGSESGGEQRHTR